MNFSLNTTTLPSRGNIFDSQTIRFIRGAVTLDAAQVVADGATGIKKLLAGTIIGATGGKYRKYVAAVKASKALGVIGDKNSITFTAVTGGTAGNAIKVALLNPGANSKPLEVTVVNDEIRIQIATSGAGALTSTAADVIAAVNASLACKTIVTAALTAGEGNDGTGVVAAVAATALASGAAANIVPSAILADDVTFTTVNQISGITHADQIVTAVDAARVITSRLPEAPDDYVKACLPGVKFV